MIHDTNYMNFCTFLSLPVAYCFLVCFNVLFLCDMPVCMFLLYSCKEEWLELIALRLNNNQSGVHLVMDLPPYCQDHPSLYFKNLQWLVKCVTSFISLKVFPWNHQLTLENIHQRYFTHVKQFFANPMKFIPSQL